jgi:hypothetical protein
MSMNARTRFRIPLVLMFLITVACSRADRPKGKLAGNPACIQIQQVIPEIFLVDDSGNSTEPIRLIIESHGGAEDLKAGEAIYSEDDKEIKATAVGDLHPGAQTIAIPAGLHSTSSSEHFEVALVGPNGKETVSLVLPLNSVGYVPPAEHDSGDSQAISSEGSDGHEDSEQQIATILPGVDPDEVMSIRQFGRDEVAITSFDGTVDRTEGDETHQPPQTLIIRGTNLKDGLIVHFSTTKGGQRIDASSSLTKTKTLGTLAIPPGYSPNNPSILFGSIVIVPSQITHSVRPTFSVRSVHGETRPECK